VSIRRRLSKMSALVSALMLCFCVEANAQTTPLSLFNGTSMLGWNTHGTWTPSGGVLATTGSGDRSAFTAMPFADFNLQFEYNESSPVGARLRLWTAHEGSGGFDIDLDIAGSSSGIGGIETFSNSSIATLPAGWHRLQVEATHGHINIRVDGIPSGTASDLGSRAGYIGFVANGNGTLQLRNIKLTLLNPSKTFSGVDLSGWKSIAHKPDAKNGMGHTIEKAFTFGMGGSTKPHEARWSVRGGAIHGEDGPGGLENDTVTEDAIFQLMAAVHGEVRKGNFTAISLRNPAGQLTGGYAVGLGPYAGSIESIEDHAFGRPDAATDQTIIISGRTIAVWVNGKLTAVHTDSRPDGTNSAQGAHTSPGPATIILPTSSVKVDVQRFNLTALPKTFGLPAHTPKPALPVVDTTEKTAASPAAANVSPAEAAFLHQQQEVAKKDATDQKNKQHIASLMGQALATSDPQQQMDAYSQVVQIDPSNAAAVQGYKEAQQKLQAQQDAQTKAATTAVTQQQDANSRQQQTDTALSQAQSAFLGGHLGEASSALSVAERLSPSNPLVRDLRARISAAQSLRSRLYFLGGGVGFLALMGIVAAWLRRRKMQRYPVLEITRGLDQGQIYPIEKDVIRIGAVAQDGGQRNEIIIRDIEHAVSRFHCEIVKRDGQLYVSDLNSSNGTCVNGASIKPGNPELLRKGSRILLAHAVELRFGYDRTAKVKKSKSV
jgi:hypothetical protein